jgi:MFS family permease
MAFIELRGQSLIFIILLTSGLDFLLFGYDQGLFGGILAGERFQDMLGNPGATMSGLVTAVYDIGCAIGAVAAFIWGERLGRKWSIILANCIVIVGAAIQTASFSYAQMLVSRIIGGIGVGLSTVAVPILQSETLPAHHRGRNRLVALLRHSPRQQLATVALPCCLPDTLLHARPYLLSLDPRDT